MKNLLLLLTLTCTLFACKSNKSRLVGKWNSEKGAFVHDPALNAAMDEVYAKDKSCGGCGNTKAMEDSLGKILQEAQNYYKNSTYQLNSDGTASISRNGKETKAKWEVEEGKEYTYVMITSDDQKEKERWFLYHGSGSSVFDGNENMLHFDFTNGGQLDREKGYYASLDLKRVDK